MHVATSDAIRCLCFARHEARENHRGKPEKSLDGFAALAMTRSRQCSSHWGSLPNRPCPLLGRLWARRWAVTQSIPHFPGAHSMNLIIWLLVGGVIGWLASMLMKTNDLPGLGR